MGNGFRLEGRRSWVLALILLAAAATAACRTAESPAVDEPPASNLEMAERLSRIAEELDPARMDYMNDVQAEILWRRIAQAARPDVSDHANYASQLLLAGRTEESLQMFDMVEQLMGGQGSPADRRALQEYRSLAFLRLGEQRNCLRRHTIDSCLVPIREGGVHTDQEGSRAALKILTELLEQRPDPKHLWLLNLAHMTLGEYPHGVVERWLIPPQVFASDFGLQRFRDVAPSTGVATISLSGGAVMDDFNADGYLDLFASSWGHTDPLRYFESDGRGSFNERTSEAWLDGLSGGLNLVHADYDNDGRLDLLVLRGAWLADGGRIPNSLLRNRGDGTFEDVTERAGIFSLHPTQTAAWGDFDGDGWLDLFIGNESFGGGHPCELYRNRGDGTFENVAARVGLDEVGFVKGAVWGDYDNDGRVDLYLSRFGQTNKLYRNEGPSGRGSWSFRDVTAEAGVGQPVYSFPTWFFDYDNDGWLDLMVGSFAGFDSDSLETVVADYLDRPTGAERARLFRNRGDGTFEDVSEAAGVHRVLLSMGANFGDFDNDGWLDMYFGTGEPQLTTLVPNVAFRNDRGRRFQDVTTSGGLGNVQKGHGIAFGDIDNDGDQDLFVVMGGAFSGDVYQNILFENPLEGRRWLTLRLEGRRSNRFAIGARVRLVVEDSNGVDREVHRVVGSGGSFGASSLQLEIGLGSARRVRRLDIAWPGGDTSSHENVPLDRIVLAVEGREELEEVPRDPLTLNRTHAAHDPS